MGILSRLANAGASHADDALRSSADEAGDAIRAALKGYHGSGASNYFDNFDARFIGAGEGNQSFGYGHYIAENPGVAADYRRKLSYRKLKDDFLNTLPEDAYSDEVMESIGRFDDRQQRFLRALENDDFLGYEYPSQAISVAMKPGGLRQYKVGRDIAQELLDARSNLGTGYEVGVHLSPESMLDWDAPLVAQKHLLQDAIDAIREQWSRENAAAVRLGHRSPVPLNAEDILTDMQSNPVYTGQSLWHTAVDAHGGSNHGEKYAADMLNETGIPGIRYLDQASRARGEGTRNMVVFPGAEDSIRILRKFGLLAPIPIGAAAAMAGMGGMENEEA